MNIYFLKLTNIIFSLVLFLSIAFFFNQVQTLSKEKNTIEENHAVLKKMKRCRLRICWWFESLLFTQMHYKMRFSPEYLKLFHSWSCP